MSECAVQSCREDQLRGETGRGNPRFLMSRWNLAVHRVCGGIDYGAWEADVRFDLSMELSFGDWGGDGTVPSAKQPMKKKKTKRWAVD